ncbi:hypothetical protein Aperf_G00000122160 [Anoplocephala perfoliata]
MSSNAIVEAIGTLLLPSVGGLIGSFVILRNVEWYRSLRKPFLAPPPWASALIWTILYITLGLASYIIVRQGNSGVSVVLPLIVFYIQLAFNWSWPIVFFGIKNFIASIIILVLTTIGASVTIYLFNGIISVAAQLLYPYLTWLIFSTFLNISIADLNRGENANDSADSNASGNANENANSNTNDNANSKASGNTTDSSGIDSKAIDNANGDAIGNTNSNASRNAGGYTIVTPSITQTVKPSGNANENSSSNAIGYTIVTPAVTQTVTPIVTSTILSMEMPDDNANDNFSGKAKDEFN